MRKDKGEDFEAALSRLEEIAERLGEGNIGLDEAVKLYEEGVELIKFARKRLREVKGKLDILKTELEEDEELVEGEMPEEVKRILNETDTVEEDEGDGKNEEEEDVSGLF
ncbi:MAG: exodeoxyribonuclease VII small subunit [Candidatus Coatesbacteria bacterium 4484_99]|uniref:Exodeoxyribonuclease 7 small subunit n=1 Tax=Candidatus Coatesbacteria bacterium 4484_99 TaxID=1970774 RepID=A0A1W9RZS5_9BACT|nr:MAG: exodeoxyribonuclease VII small subunit [Candidatus Coatesbacteria bacterium 4484_99]RLC40626.1 MAG: exodeoxyribonuclease VII small subunit [Candidatus Coatesbacteria bacterium]RLC40992.1 MAG: exodeoxyribonuclease VII small subunit [Candidatus Coatesbacteria bacterium]RLC43927.1 MAG: exodeoxyribonuclease VII small subunit [Candidatus Coatesbacteria bacterium]HEC79753.1 exodeoxyribonuclease VII small subunit [Bacillota bacterium]